MPPHLLDTIEMATVLCNTHGGFSDEDLAEYILYNQPQAQKMAVGWHPDTVAGAIGRLAQEEMPDISDITYKAFESASSAIVKAGLLGEVQSPLAKEAIAFVEAGQRSATGVRPNL